MMTEMTKRMYEKTGECLRFFSFVYDGYHLSVTDASPDTAALVLLHTRKNNT